MPSLADAWEDNPRKMVKTNSKRRPIRGCSFFKLTGGKEPDGSAGARSHNAAREARLCQAYRARELCGLPTVKVSGEGAEMGPASGSGLRFKQLKTHIKDNSSALSVPRWIACQP